MDKETEAPSTTDTESEERKPETDSEGSAPKAGGISQDEVNRIIAKEKAKLERKLRAEYEAKQTPKAAAKDESPPPNVMQEIAALRKELADSKADAAFAVATAGLDISVEDKEALREAYGTKAFDIALRAYKTEKPATAPGRGKATPGMTPSGPPQADREQGLTGATKDDVARWKEDGTLFARAEHHRNSMGGHWDFFNNAKRPRKSSK